MTRLQAVCHSPWMVLFTLSETALTVVPATGFAEQGIWERRDLQRVLRDQISTIDDGLLVVAEEFGDFEGSGRRIDLLCVDREATLVVVELKRGTDGGHLELQALRYAAMVSAMTFDELVSVYQRHLTKVAPDQAEEARTTLIEWLDDDTVETSRDAEPVLSSAVRIVLVSAGFNQEITTTVLWLNQVYGLDITCIRLTPYRLADQLLIDITQLIPLPGAEELTVRLRKRDEAVRAAAKGRESTRYVITTPDGDTEPLPKRWAVLHMTTALHKAGVTGHTIATVIPRGRFLPLPRTDEIPTDIAAAYLARYPRFRPTRYFIDHPLHDHDTTYLVTKMWGRQTEQILEGLATLGPAGFDFRAAD